MRAEAKARKTSVSRLIRSAVEAHLDVEDKKRAKDELIKALAGAGLGSWEEVHRERTEESDDRG